MKLKTIKLFIAVLCVLLFGVGNAMAGTLKVVAGIETVATGPQQNYTTYTSYFNSVTLPGQEEINQKGLGRLIYYANDHILYFDGVHRKSVTEILKPYFDYDETLTIELHGENELTIEQAREANAKIFSGNIKIVGDGSLKLNLKAYNEYRHVGAVKRIDMQGTGVVEINLINAYDDENTYAATSVHLQEGMMLSTAGYSNGPSAMGYDPTRYVFRKNGGLDYSRQDESWYSNTAWYNEHGAKWLRIEPLKKYNLFVAGKQVNWINMEDILGDGHVSYQPYSSTPGSTQGGLITLNNADIHYEYDGTNMPRIFEHSSVSDAANHVAGVHPNMLDIKLVGKNKITGVVNSQLNSETSFFGFPRMARFSGSGTLRMELSANKAAEGGVYGFGTLGAITGNTVVLQDSFTGWVSVSTSNVGTNPASVFMNNARYLVLPEGNYSDYFIAKGNTLPVVARTNVAEQNKDLNVAHVNFGKKDGSAAPTGTIANEDFLTKIAYETKKFEDETCGLSVTGGQAPFYYTATNLQNGLSINPETGYVSGRYSQANTPASDAQTTLTVTDFQGRQASVSVAKQKVAQRFTYDYYIECTGILTPEWAQGVTVTPLDLSTQIMGGEEPYTYTVRMDLSDEATPLPEGVSLDSETGVISGTPTNNESFNCLILVEDASGQHVPLFVQGNVAENYGFSVAGVPVTGLNKDNILAVAKPQDYVVSQGKISFNPTTKELTLDRFKVVFATEENNNFININDEKAFDGQPIKVHVKGDCSIKVGMMPNDGDESEFIFPYIHSINVTGENSGSELAKLTLGTTDGSLLSAVDGDVVVNGNVLLDFSTFSIPINGNLTIPADQVVYINDSANPANGGIPGDGAYTYNIGDNGDVKHIVTAPHPNGALGFTNKKESKTIYNTVPVKPFAMFDVMGGVAPYSYSATSLPSGLVIDEETGYISGTSKNNNSNTTVTFTVTDAMGRKVSTDMELAVKNPTLNLTICGGSEDRSTKLYNWSIAQNLSLEDGQLCLVESDFDFEETLISIPKNKVFLDVKGNTYAKNIALKDGVKYAFPYEVEAQSVSYTRTFSDKVAGKWQCLYVPFDITVTEELLKDFEFAKLYMISYKDANNNGEIEDGEPLVMLLMKQTEGKVLHANTPYFIKAKTAGTKSIEVESATLKPVENGTVYCCTTEHEYTLTGIYNTFNINGNYTMGVSGGFSYYDTDTNLKPNRWYMNINSLTGKDDENAAKVRQIILMVDGEDDTTGIMDITSGSKTSTAEGVFTLDGRKINETENLSRGIYIKNGKKIMVK